MAEAISDTANKWGKRVDTDLQVVSGYILQYFPSVSNRSYIKKVAALHLYVYEKVDYERRNFGNDPRDMRMPKECWRSSGNCQEQIVLLASLLKSVPELEMRTKALSHNRESDIGHRTFEVRFPYAPEDVKEVLKNFYQKTPHFDGSAPKMSWNRVKNKNDTWIVADPTMSRCLGDLSSHRNKGYVTDTEDSWKWHQVDSKHSL